MRNVTTVILAAGESKRMNSKVSKLLHRVGECHLVEFPLKACINAEVGRVIVVVGHQANEIKQVLKGKCEFVYQKERLGTGDALQRVAPLLSNFQGELVVLPGDAPFINSSLLKGLVANHRKKKSTATVLTAVLPDPGSYGRVIRNGSDSVKRIVESKNATAEELKIREINSGIYCFNTQKVIHALPYLTPNEVNGEIYLTDIFEIFHQREERVETLPSDDPRLAIGINTPEDLEKAYRLLVQK